MTAFTPPSVLGDSTPNRDEPPVSREVAQPVWDAIKIVQKTLTNHSFAFSGNLVTMTGPNGNRTTIDLVKLSNETQDPGSDPELWDELREIMTNKERFLAALCRL